MLRLVQAMAVMKHFNWTRHSSDGRSDSPAETDSEKESFRDSLCVADIQHGNKAEGDSRSSHLTDAGLESSLDVEQIPNGGLVAWLQVVAGFFFFFNAWGLVNSFGVFQDYYQTVLLPHVSESDISWIGSIEAFLLCCTTLFAGVLYDRGFGRILVCTGSFMVVFGLMMTSLCRSYWQLMLAQGLCVGIGAGQTFIVSVAIVPSYFTTKRAFATGIAASGSSIGGVIYPIVFHRIVSVVGFGWATRVVAFIALATLAIACSCIRMPAKPTPRPRIVDLSGFRELPFSLFSLASFVGFIGLYIPFFYISTFASTRVGLGPNISFYLLPIMSAGSTLGRLIPSFVADRLGPLSVLSVCTLIAGILGLSWIGISAEANTGSLIVWALLYGCFSGAFVSLQPTTVVTITDDMTLVGGRIGMNTFCAALGLLIGTPIAGVLVGSDHSWTGLQLLCGSTLLVSAVLVMATRVSRVGVALGRKA